MIVRPGRYRRYKGNEYPLIGVVRHSETEEELVVYRQECWATHTLGASVGDIR
jgi:hypothetical protein